MAGEFLASFVNEEGLGRFLHGVSRDSVEAPPEMVALLDALPGNHLHTLVLLMGSERAEHSRRVARSLVERYVPHHGDWIVSKLAGAESAVAVELLRALRMADPDRALTGVQEVATRLEPELQIECLATLDAQVTGPVVSRVLLGYVESPHEEPRVQALEQVGRRQIALAYAQLVPLCKRRVGLGMSTAERDGWGWALVRCDRAQAMVDFRDWIRPRGFFRSALPGQETLQWIAVSGLAHVPGPEAEQLIRTAAEVGGSELEKHCVQTMVRRRRTARAGTR
jgi:hypothetical protein